MIAVKSLEMRRNMLLGYWLIVPFLFFFYLFLLSLNQKVEVQQLVLQIPGLALSLLLSFLTIFQAAVLYFISTRFADSQKTMKKFLLFSLVQQILTGNIVGAALSFFLERKMVVTEEKESLDSKIVFYSAAVFISFVTAVVLLIAIQMRGGQ